MTSAARTLSNQRARAAYRAAHPSKYEHGQFIAWDGEGITDADGSHRYVILANSDGDYISNPNGLDTESCFEMLLSKAAKNPLAIHVIFGGTYDANMMLQGSLSRAKAARLHHTGTCTILSPTAEHGRRRYRVMYRPRHEFSIREEYWDPDKMQCVTLRRVTLWDVIGSFQSTFVKACESRLSESDLVELFHIETMKAKRSTFTVEDMPEMLRYCFAELQALKRLQEIDYEDAQAAGILGQTRWDGAGAKATILLRNHKVQAHKAEFPQMMPAFTGAYAGGRIETYRFGQHDGPCWTLDIKSAYPWAATKVPSLVGGKWETYHGEPESIDDYSVFYVQYASPDVRDLHPFFWRGRQGQVCYPALTEGWVWGPELWAALQSVPERVRILDGYTFTPATDDKPFAWIPQAFHARQALDKQRKGRGQPLKLALNSVYGKLAQQIGGHNGKAPASHQLDWAGFITSRIRAEMFALAYSRKSQLVSIETDGLSFLGEPDVPEHSGSGDLGTYDIAEYAGGVWVQSGIYWLLDRQGWWHPPKVRGIARSLNGSSVLRREDFTEAWDRGEWRAKVPVQVTRFRSIATSVTTPKRFKDWCKWITETRELSAEPSGKRIHMDCHRPSMWQPPCVGGMHETEPVGGGSPSRPHELKWLQQPYTPDDMWWNEDDDEFS